MNILIFGATGMVGQGVLGECLKAEDVDKVTVIGRRAPEISHPKLRAVVVEDMTAYDGFEAELSGHDACFYCLGVSSFGMDEASYSKITYDLALAAARPLARLNPGMTFVFVSGAGTDSSERGRTMWARVKGRTENALLKLPFKAVHLFRPGLIQPLDGIRSRTLAYRLIYPLLQPLLPLAKGLFPNAIVTTRSIGQAMLTVARQGWKETVLDPAGINAAARVGTDEAVRRIPS